MSTTVSAGVWQCGPRDMAARFVLLAIAENADDYGYAFPSHETIAQKTCCDRRTIIRRLEELELSGWLRVLRKVVNGKGNLYWINLEKLGVIVSPEARKSQMITSILRRSGVSESPIFWPEKSGDTKEISGDNPQPTQVTETQSHVTPVQVQVTQLRHKNRKQPSLPEPSLSEPSTDVEPTPLPPRAGGEFSETELLERWDRFRLRLKEDLAGVPANASMRRFAEIVPGENDFDSCFRDWWIVECAALRHVNRGVVRVTLTTACDIPANTRKAIEKYGPRLQHRAREYFDLSPLTAVDFVVAERNHEQNPAA